MRAAIYVRVSTSAQAGEDRLSLPEQARELTALCVARDWQIAEPPAFPGREALPEGVFGDPGISGDGVETRPGMVALLEVVKGGGIGAVLVRDTNRLARHELAAQQIHAVLEAHGVLLVTPAMEYDYANLQHRLMLGLLGSIEAYAKRWLVGNMRRARQAKKDRGEFGNAHAPYGFRWDKQAKRPVPIPEEIEVVREVYRLSTQEGMSTEEIAERLRERKVPTRKAGGWWYSSHVGRILQHPCYKGEWHTTEGVLAKDAPEAVIDSNTWAAAQRVIERHRTNHGPRVRRDFLLAKLIFCECGSSMTGRRPTGSDRHYIYYTCNARVRGRPHACEGRYVRAEPLEDAAWQMVEALARNPGQIEKLLAATEQDMLPRWQQELKRTEKLLKDQEFEHERVMVAYRRGVTTLEQFAEEKQQIEAEQVELRARAQHLEALIQGEQLRQQTVDRVTLEIEAIAERLDSMTMPERRGLLRRLAFRVTVSPDGSRARVEFAGAPFLASEGLSPVLSHSDEHSGRRVHFRGIP